MISLYFGLPRCGKTTLISRIAYLASHGHKVNGRLYKHVFCNVHLSDLPGVTYIDSSWIGLYDMSDSLILIDEGTIAFDARSWKTFTGSIRNGFLLHGHYRQDIMIFTQRWDGIDLNIRTITEKVFYIQKSKLFPWISYFYQIPYGIIIPDKKQQKQMTGQTLGEIIQGYCKPPLLKRIFCHRIWRPRWYRYFDSWEAPVLPPVPERLL